MRERRREERGFRNPLDDLVVCDFHLTEKDILHNENSKRQGDELV